MSKSRILIISLKYAPGLWKEFTLIGRKLREQGIHVSFLVSHGYQLHSADHEEEVQFWGNSRNSVEIIRDVLGFSVSGWKDMAHFLRRNLPDVILYYNPHPLNAIIARLAKQILHRTRQILFLHEPYKRDKSLYGWKGAYFGIVEAVQDLTIRCMDDIILPSPFANLLFREAFPHFPGKTHLAPLLLPDNPARKQKREFFSLVGTINFSKRPDLVFRTANLVQDLGLDFKFLVATSGNLDPFMPILNEAAEHRVVRINPKHLSDEVISDCLARSWAAFGFHDLVTQSGSVPVAFMQGTPVIARSDPGFAQFVFHGRNGWLLPNGFTPKDVIKGMQFVQESFPSLANGARKSFELLFSEETWQGQYQWLLNDLQGCM